jgi:hypothetical protein
VSADDEEAKTMVATCTGGRKVIGGGWILSNVSDDDVLIEASYPSSNTEWSVIGSNEVAGGNHSYSLQAYAVCANVTT